MYLLNAFSLQMLEGSSGLMTWEIIPPPTAAELAAMESAVGHADTAAILGVQMRRVNVTLRPGESAIIAQITRGRLPEGAKTLPEGVAFKFFRVAVETTSSAAATLGRKGGSARTPAKQAASRRNGMKGGAPKAWEKLASAHTREELVEAQKGISLAIDKASGLELANLRRRYWTYEQAIAAKRW